MTKQIEAFEAWWADTGEQSLYALNTITDDDIKILAGIAWEAAIREVLADHIAASGKPIAEPAQEPVGVISESAIGLVKLHSNGVSLPFGTPLYAAPVHPMQEPVAWRYNSNGDWIYKDRKVWDAAEPLYTAPLQPVKQEPVAYTNKEQVNELIKESARLIGSIKDEGDQYLTAIDALRNAYRLGLKDSPVDAKAIRAEALEEAAKWFEGNEDDVGYAIAAEIRGIK